MTRDEVLSILATDAVFANLQPSQIEWLAQGRSSHSCRIQVGAREFFVKDVQPQERDVLRRLSQLNLRHVPPIRSSRLLEKMILVTDYIAGGTMQDLALDADLVREMAVIQNHCSGSQQDSEKAREHCRSRAIWCFARAAENLQSLRSGTTCTEIVDYERVFSTIEARTSDVAQRFASMPLARLHHDFYPNNILAGPPQVVVDWGSSYGNGPFLYDLAPYLLLSAANLAAFAETSDLCGEVGGAQLQEWLICATSVRFASFLKGVFDRGPGQTASAGRWSRFLGFHWPMFAALDTDIAKELVPPHGR